MGKKLLTKKIREERYKSNKGIILYNPTEEQYQELKSLIRVATTKKDNGDFVTDLEDISYIKYIYENLTSQKEEVENMGELEFGSAIYHMVFEVRDRENIRLYREVEKLVKEVVEDIKYEFDQEAEELNALLDAILLKENNEELNEKISKVLKTYKIGQEDFEKFVGQLIEKGIERDKLKLEE